MELSFSSIFDNKLATRLKIETKSATKVIISDQWQQWATTATVKITKTKKATQISLNLNDAIEKWNEVKCTSEIFSFFVQYTMAIRSGNTKGVIPNNECEAFGSVAQVVIWWFVHVFCIVVIEIKILLSTNQVTMAVTSHKFSYSACLIHICRYKSFATQSQKNPVSRSGSQPVN